MHGKSIQKSDGSREAVLESVGTCPQTYISFSRRKEAEERMSGVCGVLNYAGWSSMESMEGRLVCVMDWATFTIFCSFLQSWAEQEPYQAVVQPERMLSMVHL